MTLSLSLSENCRPVSFLFHSMDPIPVTSPGLLPGPVRREEMGSGSAARKSLDSSVSSLASALPDWDLGAGLRSALRRGQGFSPWPAYLIPHILFPSQPMF